jgi:PilZ domain
MPVATEDVMQERRRVPRHRTLKAGSITFNRDGGVDCRVRNLSPAGACLEVASQLGIPDELVLVVEIDHVKASCHVIWRTATRLGVVFDAQEQLRHAHAGARSAGCQEMDGNAASNCGGAGGIPL